MIRRRTLARTALCALVLGAAALPARDAAAGACPNIMLVLDQSGSMAQDPSGGMSHPSKWELMVQVVSDVVQQYGDHVPFGLLLYTSNSFRNDAQCLNDATVTVPLSHNAPPDILKALAAASPLNQTNTGEAVQVAAGTMQLMDPNRPNYILLVTDGDPDCNSLDKQGDAEFTINQITAAQAQTPPVYTYVVGFDGSGGVNPRNLDQMAFAGGKAPSGCQGKALGSPCYFVASDAQTFRDAILGIVSDVGGGEFGGGTICDDSCYATGCPSGQKCLTEELNPAPHCVPDPCMGAQCTGSTFCRGGQCVRACTSGCKAGEICSDGACVADKCRGVTCASSQVCDRSTGGCVDAKCPVCTNGGFCDLASGRCVTDLCRVVTCPSGTTCVNNGNCVGSPRAGCAASGRGPATGGVLGAFLVLAGALVLRRGRRRRAASASG